MLPDSCRVPAPAFVNLPVPLMACCQSVAPPSAIVRTLLLAIVEVPELLLTVMLPVEAGSVEPRVTFPSSTTPVWMNRPEVPVERRVPLRIVSGPIPNGVLTPAVPLLAHCTTPPSRTNPPEYVLRLDWFPVPAKDKTPSPIFVIDREVPSWRIIVDSESCVFAATLIAPEVFSSNSWPWFVWVKATSVRDELLSRMILLGCPPMVVSTPKNLSVPFAPTEMPLFWIA